MRKIERNMCQAVIERRNWKCGNTEVRIVDGPGYKTKNVLVLLHGTPIVQYDWQGNISVQHAGYRTATTKSRLNAFLRMFGRHGYGICQRAYAWFLTDANGERDMFQDWWYEVA